MKRKSLNGNKDINYQIDLLKKINEWTPKLLSEKLVGLKRCDNCLKYSLEKDFKITLVEEDREVTTYIDHVYGDDDSIGLVKYGVKYAICPLCKDRKSVV